MSAASPSCLWTTGTRPLGSSRRSIRTSSVMMEASGQILRTAAPSGPVHRKVTADLPRPIRSSMSRSHRAARSVMRAGSSAHHWSTRELNRRRSRLASHS